MLAQQSGADLVITQLFHLSSYESTPMLQCCSFEIPLWHSILGAPLTFGMAKAFPKALWCVLQNEVANVVNEVICINPTEKAMSLSDSDVQIGK
jgi:hypothetical protein